MILSGRDGWVGALFVEPGGFELRMGLFEPWMETFSVSTKTDGLVEQ